jgi:CRP-like cAMP-binding protein
VRHHKELRNYADERLFEGDFEGAAHGYIALVEAQPADLDARLRIADSLLSMGEVQRAATVYTALARHCVHAGYPLRALVAIKVLEALEPQLGALVSRLAGLYAAESGRLGRSVRASLADPVQPVPDLGARRLEGAALAERGVEVGADFTTIGAPYPDRLPPIPLFSRLPADSFAAVLASVRLHRVRPGETIVAEGERGEAFYVIARGTVRIAKATENGQAELAQLSDGALFGEMAMISEEPRMASAIAVTDCDLLEFDKHALSAAADAASTIAEALDRFMHERLVMNLLSSAPIFRPLDPKQRMDLLRRFTARDFRRGATILKQGEAGSGLHVMLYGEAEAWKREGNTEHRITALKPGDVFGATSLLEGDPVTASVRAASRVKVLFLAKEYFQRLLQAVPELREYIERVGAERLMDVQLALAEDPMSWDDSATVTEP